MEKEKQEGKDGVELKISMHCNACERCVANAIAKLKGVEKFTTDMRRQRVVITGEIDAQKVMKKLKKKTGKRVEVVVPPKQEEEETKVMTEASRREGEALMVLFGVSDWRGCDLTTMFSDENPNACLVM